MPYDVPEGFFDELETNVMEELGLKQETGEIPPLQGESQTRPEAAGKPPKGRLFRIALPAVLSATAAVFLFFVLQTRRPDHDIKTGSFESVELAYNNLSTEDQEFLMEVYEEDLFINDYNNTEDYEAFD